MKMSQSVTEFVIGLCLAALLVLCFDDLASPYLVHPVPGSNAWQLLIHTGFNAVFWWFTPERLFSGSCAYIEMALSALVITITLLSFDHRVNQPISAKSLLHAAIPVLLLVWLFGLDTPLFTGLACVLLMFRTIELILSSDAAEVKNSMMYVLITAVFNLVFSNQFSPYILAMIALVLVSQLTEDSKRNERVSLLASIALLACFLGWTTSIQRDRPVIPDFGFAGAARVVADDGIPGNVTPLIGETTAIPFIDRLHLKETFKMPALILAFFTLIIVMRDKERRSRLSWILVPLTITLLWDVIPRDTIATLGPIQVMRRILPGTFPFVFSSFAVSLLLIVIWLNSRSGIMRIVLTGSLLLISLHPGALNGISSQPLMQLLGGADADNSSSDAAIVASPSLALLKAEGLPILSLLKKREMLRPATVAELDGSITVSHMKRIKARKLLSDDRLDTRWSPRRGAQYGDEWIEVRLPRPQLIGGIQALTGRYFSDFPRGLSIATCRQDDGGRGTPLQQVKRIPDWQGGIDLSPQGYPFYTGQHDVSVFFAKPVSTDCLLISQIGESANFDWSIAELRLLLK